MFTPLVFLGLMAGTLAQAPSCKDIGEIGSSAGGQNIGLVIDASGSMSSNDRDNKRLDAAKLINSKLLTSAAAGGQPADQVTVVQFDTSADVLYELGDPSGADGPISGITPGGGTYIGSGVKAAVDELAGAGGGAAGIVVFTDGQTTKVTQTVAELQNAIDKGIRVSIGFLSVDASLQDEDIVDAVLRSGGTFGNVDTADDVPTFVKQVLLNGLTGAPATGGSVTVLGDIQTFSILEKTAKNTFKYKAQAGESFNITVKGSYEDLAVKVTLTEAGGAEIATAESDSVTGEATMSYNATADIDLEILVEGGDADTTGIFSIELESSLDPCVDAPITSDPPYPTTTIYHTYSNTTTICTTTSHPPPSPPCKGYCPGPDTTPTPKPTPCYGGCEKAPQPPCEGDCDSNEVPQPPACNKPGGCQTLSTSVSGDFAKPTAPYVQVGGAAAATFEGVTLGAAFFGIMALVF